MRELSLHILDIVENSVKAGASLIKVYVVAEKGYIEIEVVDNGKGMDAEFLKRVCDPFTTTRTTRKVGLGIPLLKMAAETANGSFEITSAEGIGTTVYASFEIDNVDRAPLGDLVSTITTQLSNTTDYVWTYKVNEREFIFDTREVKKELDGVPIDSPEIMVFIKDLITDNLEIVNGGVVL